MNKEADGYRLRVLVIAYYFPPMGLSGVQRISKFVKYLPEFDWQTTVLTIEPGAYYAFDQSLLDELENRDGIEIIRTGSLDPTRFFPSGKALKMPSERRRKLSSWVSQLLYVPDNKLGWRKAAVERGKQILSEHPYDVIYATAPPYTALMVGLDLCRWSGIPLISDFRDDWLGNPRHVYPTPWHRRKNRKLESEVITNSSIVTTVNRVIQDRLVRRHLGAKGYNRVFHLAQGFDPEDFSPESVARTDGKLRLLYSGVFYDAQQPDTFLRALQLWRQRNPEDRDSVEARFVGLMSDRALALIDALDLTSVVTASGYQTHDATVEELLAADVLWMMVGRQKGEETIGTGKLFEYFGTRKPVLGLVPDGAAGNAIQEYGAGFIARPDDVEEIISAIGRIYRLWKENRLPVPDEDFVVRHNRKRLTGELAKLFRGTLKTE